MAKKKGRNMYKVNKNFLMLGCCLALATSGTISAYYEVHVENNTGERVSGKVNLAKKKGVAKPEPCNPREFKLNPRKGFLRMVIADECCITGITFKGETSGARGSYNPAQQAGGLTCNKNVRFEIQQKQVVSKLVGMPRAG